MTLTDRFPVLVLLAVLTSGGGLVVACTSSGDPAAPSRNPVRPSFEDDAGGGASSGAPNTSGGLDGGCFDAATTPPSTPAQFLNQCNASGCFPFDNAARIEGFTPGAPLPSLD